PALTPRCLHDALPISSAMQTKVREAPATIFSRVSAPPPPLIRCRCLVDSSAPSTYTDSSPASFRSSTGMPCPRRRSALATELARSEEHTSELQSRENL